MTKLILTLGLGLALTACNNADNTIVGGPADGSGNLPAESNIVLPPPVQATKAYRCDDGSTIKIDWLADGKSATVRPGEGGSPIAVSAAEAGQPMTAADGTSLTGTKDDSSVKLGIAGKPTQSCKG